LCRRRGHGAVLDSVPLQCISGALVSKRGAPRNELPRATVHANAGFSVSLSLRAHVELGDHSASNCLDEFLFSHSGESRTLFTKQANKGVRQQNLVRPLCVSEGVWSRRLSRVPRFSQRTGCRISIPLSWPFHEFGPRDIPTGPDFYVDLVRISKHASGWNLCIENDYPNHAPLKTYRGIYRFHLVATSDTAESANFVLDITYEGDWHGLRVHNIGSTIS